MMLNGTSLTASVISRLSNTSNLSVAVLTLLYAIVFSTLAIHRFSLMGDCYDLSIFEQAFWSTINEGLPLYTSQDGPNYGRFSHFSSHFTPFLFLWVPFYWLWQAPQTLLILKTLALGLAAFPLYRLAMGLLRFRTAGLLVVLIYFLYPPLHGVNMWGFHENEFAVAPMLVMLLGYERRSWILFWTSLFAVLTVKESMTLTAAAFGFYLLLFQREKKIGLITVAVSLSWLFVAQWIIIPFAAGSPLFEMDRRFFNRYDPLVGQSYGEIVSNIATRPLQILSYAFGNADKRAYLFDLLFPLAFVPFIVPKLLLVCVPVVAQNLLSAYQGQYALLGQYHAEIIPILIYALCLAIKRIEQSWAPAMAARSDLVATRSSGVIICALGIILIATTIANFRSPIWSFAVGKSDFLLAISKREEGRKTALEYISLIPEQASVISDVSMISHLGGRAWLNTIYREAFVVRDWDYVLIDLRFPWIANITTQELARTLNDKGYRSLANNGIVLFKRPNAPEKKPS
jgi:uncharacterized membrane protein